MKRNNWNKENIISFIENEVGYTFIDFKEFKNSNSIVTVMCKEGHIYSVNFNSLRKGRKCRKCSGSMKYTLEEVQLYLEKYNYKLLSNEYIDNKTKLKIQCSLGHIFEMRFNNFLRGIRCPICNKSNGEEEVERILNKYNIKYKYQQYFNDCRDKNPMPFDFYIKDYNTIIEFDGEQHFKIKFSMTENEFENIKKHDKIKTQYCKDNNIKLIRIPYWEFNNIENIICQELKLK